MKCDFKPGDEVICIDDIFNPKSIWDKLITPKVNQKYTIREVLMHEYMDETCPAVLLQEIINPPMINPDTNYMLKEMPFAYWRFKKLDKLKKKEEVATGAFNDWLKVSDDDANRYRKENEDIKETEDV